MTTEKRKWGWSRLTRQEVREDLKLAMEANIDYSNKDDIIIGFPGTKPHYIAERAYKMFVKSHPNNICTHTSSESEMGFLGTQRLEKEAIFMAAKMLGVQSPEGKIEGYLAPGGTEANIMGIYLGRKWLQSLRPMGGDVCVC